MRITLKDIAERVGVDPSAVSLALRPGKSGRLSPQLVEKIRTVAHQMGYRPNLSAAYLRHGATRCIGVAMSYFDHYPCNHYFHLISQRCRQAGYHAVPLETARRFHGADVMQQAIDATPVHVDGVIAIDYLPPAVGEALFGRLPMVYRVTDDQLPRAKAPGVLVDEAQAVRQLMALLLERGWRKFLFVVEDDPARPWGRGYSWPMPAHMARVLEEVGRENRLPILTNERLIRTPGRLAKHRYEAVLSYFEKHPLKDRVCLIHEGADGISGTYSALSRLGYAVGNRVGVAAFNATPPWEHVLPCITYVYEEHERISRVLVEMAIDRIENSGTYADGTRLHFAKQLELSDSV